MLGPTKAGMPNDRTWPMEANTQRATNNSDPFNEGPLSLPFCLELRKTSIDLQQLYATLLNQQLARMHATTKWLA